MEKNNLEENLSSKKFEEVFIEINSRKINFKKFESADWNNVNNFLILHWWWWSSDSWVEVAKKLSEKNFNVFVPDLPGHWKTELSRYFTIDDYWDFVVKFAKEIWLKNFNLIAHSNWWRIFLKLLNRWIFYQNIDEIEKMSNEEKKEFVEKFLEKNSHIAKNLQKQFFLEKIFLMWCAWIRPKLNFKQKFIQTCSKYFPFFKKIKFLRVLVLKLIWGQDYLQASKDYHLKQTFLNVLNTDLTEILPKIKEKIFLIWWDHDTYTPLWMWKKMNKLLKNSELEILEWEKHWIHLHNADLLVEKVLDKF